MVSTRKMRHSSSSSSSDHQKWEIIFSALKKILQKQAQQLDSLLGERKLLQERIQLQYQRWNSDVRLLEDIISQKQRQLSLSELGKLVEVSKADLFVGSKQRDSLINKLKLEHAWSELNDFKAWFDILSHRCPDKEDISPERVYESLKAKGGRHSTSKEAYKHNSKLEKEVATLKHEYEKLSVKHMSDVSALKDENSFVWNQYKTMESNYTNQLKAKNDEINQANEKIMNLLKSLEQLQSISIEKDETVATLKANINSLEAEVHEKDGLISSLSEECELIRSKNADGGPLLNHCSTELSSSGLKVTRSSRKKESAALEEEATSVQLRATILSLRAKLSEVEADRNQKSEEMSRLSKESKLLRSKTSARSGDRGNGRNVGTVVADEASSMQLEATIATLKDKITELEAQANQKNGEISALSKELKLLRSKGVAGTPVLKHCTSGPSSSKSRGRKNCKDRSAPLKEEASSSQLVSEQGGTRSKRKRDDVISLEDTPRLFTSQFKIPKLRSQSPRGR